MQIETLYAINQYVIIKEIDVLSRIIAIKLEGNNLTYQVEYWNNGLLQVVWQDEDQLKRKGV